MSSSKNSTPDVLGADHPKYKKIKDINQGTFGFVQLCQQKDSKEIMAIKFVERGETITKYIEREILNHRTLIHPHVIGFRECFLTQKYLAIVMEYAAGGDMFDFVVKRGGLKEDEARWFFQQLIVAIDYCHRMAVINRDIKLENTLLDGSSRPLLKLCDFGYSKHELMHSQPKSKVGTPGYIAPEIIKSDRYEGKMADVWSCGVMLYVMLVGGYPFERAEDKTDNNKLQTMIQRILRADYIIPKSLTFTPECLDLLSKILVVDPNRRITIEQIFLHPWFRKNLPPGVDQMNNVLPLPPPEAQSEEEIIRIVKMAQTKVGPEQKVFNKDHTTDEYIESALTDLGSKDLADEFS
eukprot:TRINITY_DN1166_c0_g2_i1.p1 TRINITY_DN1166_c0_g2~~TRINITY_DN1166_c0_g2_i1.p1  ORF type:complete len:352 (+),score=48.30 TRINITY_DN1166_c0_g2_i1:107-1162(+)